MAEKLCESYSRQYGLSTAIVRLFSVYGAGLRKQLLWDACNRLARGETRFSGTGAERRDWLNVEDAAELLLHAAERASAACPVANGGSGIAVPVRDVLQLVAHSLGRAEGLEFNGEGRRGDPAHYHADVTVARTWGWEPRIDWRAGVQAFADWFKAGAQ
jgi:UDP-glucose 4-epimerase